MKNNNTVVCILNKNDGNNLKTLEKKVKRINENF